MYKIIDLDQATRDGEGLVLTLTINGEKLGFLDQDVAELIRSKHGGGSAKGVKRAPAKKAAPVTEAAPASELSTEPPVEEADREVEELATAH